MAEKGVSAEQVERVKKRFAARRKQELVNTSRLAISLCEWAAMGDWRLYFLMRDRMEKVTPADVRAAAKKYLVASNRTVGLYIPTKEPERTPVPPTPDVVAILKDYRGRSAASAGEELDPDPEKIEARVQRPAPIGGVKVALLPKKTRQEMAVVHLTLRYGNEENLKGMRAAAEILPRLMMRGTKKLSRQQIQDALDAAEARLRAGGGLGDVTFTLEAPRPHLAEALEVLRQVVREPSFPAEEFEVMRRERLARLEEGRTEPRVLAGEALQRKMNPYPAGDVRYVPTTAEEMEEATALNLEQVRSLYDRYLGAGAGELSAVGDFDPDELMGRMKGMLEAWSASMPYARITRGVLEAAGPRVEQILETPDKANAVYLAGTTLAMSDADPDYPAFTLAGYVLGGMPSARLFVRVREKDGLSYGAYGGTRASALDRHATITLNAIYNPANASKVRSAMAEEVAKIASGGVTAEELERAKASYLKNRQMSRSQEQSLAGTLAADMHADRTLKYEAELDHKIRSLTVEQVSAAAKKYFDAGKLWVVTAGDFANASKYAGAAGGGGQKSN